MSGLNLALTLFAILGTALISGTFFAFSTFVMPALGNRPAREAVAAMQEINIVVVRSLFIGVFLGTAAVSLAIGIIAAVKYDGLRSMVLMAGALCYVVGTFGVTIAFNVPRNNALAAVKADDARLETAWADYLKTWTRWNHVRTVFAALACVLFAAAEFSAVAGK
ncbi:MAG: DUF1772 domain-containing protein [Pyrinomonadaceae bacterium]|nr:DUF1772 domain-containing protein [Pyrinomonadaceae bacterium]